MKVANIRYAKAHLSEMIRMVKEGESVVITERNAPVAMLSSITYGASGGTSDWIQRQVRKGVLRPPREASDTDALLRLPRAKAGLLPALLAEREDGR